MALKFNGINRNFLTFVLLIIFSVLVSKINCDLAPKEEDDDDVPQEQLDLKKDISLTTLKPDNVSKLGFIHAFVAAFSVIIVSEIGDKTFFIAAIMSMVNIVYVISHPSMTHSNLSTSFLEISTIDCLFRCNLSISFNDCIISCIWNSLYSVHTTSHYTMDLSAPICPLWTQNVTWRI